MPTYRLVTFIIRDTDKTEEIEDWREQVGTGEAPIHSDEICPFDPSDMFETNDGQGN